MIWLVSRRSAGRHVAPEELRGLANKDRRRLIEGLNDRRHIAVVRNQMQCR